MSRSSAFESRAEVVTALTSASPYTHDLDEKYVYLYRDPFTFEIRYVGLATLRNKGRGRQRPEDHLTCKQLSCEVRPWVQRLIANGVSPIIEVINCGDDEERAKAVEGALISALWGGGERGLLNHIHGHGEKFRPLGSPRSVAGRRLLEPLTRQTSPAWVLPWWSTCPSRTSTSPTWTRTGARRSRVVPGRGPSPR